MRRARAAEVNVVERILLGGGVSRVSTIRRKRCENGELCLSVGLRTRREGKRKGILMKALCEDGDGSEEDWSEIGS